MQTNHTKQYHVFLSHSSNDKAHVEKIAVRLEDEAGLKPFLDKWHLIPGEPWQEALEEALDQSRTCAVFLGPNGLGAWENEEMRSALDERVKNKSLRVIPVLLPGANQKDPKTLPRFLRRLTWVHFRTGIDEEEAFNSLVAGILGKKPGRHCSDSMRQKRVQWVLVLSGTIEDMDKARAEAIVAHLRQLSGDMTMTIQKIEAGSIKLTIEGTEDGFERIESLFRQGNFHDVLGMKVLSKPYYLKQPINSEQVSEPPIDHLLGPYLTAVDETEAQRYLDQLIAHVTPIIEKFTNRSRHPQDSFQETVRLLVKSLRNFRSDPIGRAINNYQHYVALVAQHVCLRAQEMVAEADSSLAMASPLPEEEVLAREFVQRLWIEVEHLPPLQRIVFLLNFTPMGSDVDLFVIYGVASVRRIGAVLQLSDEHFARVWPEVLLDEKTRSYAERLTSYDEKFAFLWRHLPLDDGSIARVLGLKKQQVINLRSRARSCLRKALSNPTATSQFRSG